MLSLALGYMQTSMGWHRCEINVLVKMVSYLCPGHNDVDENDAIHPRVLHGRPQLVDVEQSVVTEVIR